MASSQTYNSLLHVRTSPTRMSLVVAIAVAIMMAMCIDLSTALPTPDAKPSTESGNQQQQQLEAGKIHDLESNNVTLHLPFFICFCFI